MFLVGQLPSEFDVSAITRPQLANLIGRDYTWLDSRCRRAREQMTLAKVEPGAEFPRQDADAIEILPLKDISQGKWARFDAEDAISMGVTLELEDAGLTFQAAAKIAVNAGAVRVLALPADAEDLWLAVQIDRDAMGQSRGHTAGTLVEIAEAMASHRAAITRNQGPEEPVAVIMVNASAVLRRLKVRARGLGIDAALGWGG